MDEVEVIEFLEWLEKVFGTNRIHFPDKTALAKGYMNHLVGKEIRERG